MIKYKISFSKSESVVHFAGAGQADYALCGHDLAGDSCDWRGEYKEATQTRERVNCPHCIRIVRHCRGIRNSEMEV